MSSIPQTTALSSSNGWFYDLLTKSGVSPTTAHNVVEFVIRPLGIVLVVVIAALLARYGTRIIRRVIGRLAQPAVQRSGSGRTEARLNTMLSLAGNVWRFVVTIIAVAVILGMLGINLTPFVASATVIGAIIAFGAQTLVRDYLSGFLLAVEDQFGIGDTITVNDVTGIVEEVTLRVTTIREFDGSVWYVANGDIRKVSNTSRGWAKAVIDLTVAPSEQGDLDRAKNLILSAAREVARSPLFATSSRNEPQVLGVVSADSGTCEIRLSLRTSTARRAELERALREAAVSALIDAGLWAKPA